MKKNYQKPTMLAVKLQHHSQLMQTSDTASVTSVESNVGIGLGSGSNGPARVRQHSGFDWDNEWD